MSIKSWVRGALVACLLALPMASLGGGPVTTTVTINQVVDTFAEWDVGATCNFNVATHITGSAAVTDTKTFHLYTNADVAAGTDVKINLAAVADTNGNASGILKNSSASNSLDTYYEVTGGGVLVADRDGAYSDAATYLAANKTYHLNTGVGAGEVSNGNYTIVLGVKAQVPGGTTAPPATTYTCALTITATW